MQAPNFVTGSQDFQIEFVKSGIHLKNSKISDIKHMTMSKREIQKETGGRELFFLNGGILFNTGELEHMFFVWPMNYSGTSLKRTSSKLDTSLRQTKHFVRDEFLRNA